VCVVSVLVQGRHVVTDKLCVRLSNVEGLTLQTCPGARQYGTKQSKCKCIKEHCETAVVIKIYSHFTSQMTTGVL